MRRVVSLYLPTWPTDRYRKSHGAPPREAPLVIATRRVKTESAPIDEAATAIGIRRGMTVAHAQALCPASCGRRSQAPTLKG